MKTTPCTGNLIQPMPKYAFNSASRCGATTRSKKLCKSPTVKNNKRCRMHGGKGSGAPKSNKNALKHGHTTQQAKDKLKEIKDMLKVARKCVNQFES